MLRLSWRDTGCKCAGGVRQKVGIADIQTVPTAHLVSTCLGQSTATNGIAGCDFSEYSNAIAQQQKVSPAGYNLVYQQQGATSVPYPGNVIPTAALSPQSLSFLKLLQPYAPNTAGQLVGGVPGLRANYAGSGSGLFNSDQWDVRGYYQVSERIHAFRRFNRFTDTSTGMTLFGAAGGAGFGIGGYGGTSQGANDSSAAGLDIVVNNSLVTDIRLGYFRYDIATAKYDQGTNLASQLGITRFEHSRPNYQRFAFIQSDGSRQLWNPQ